MAKSVFQVAFRPYWDRKEQGRESVVVIADSAEMAIKKCKSAEVGESWEWEDDKGRKRMTKVTSVKILSVDHLNDIDY